MNVLQGSLFEDSIPAYLENMLHLLMKVSINTFLMMIQKEKNCCVERPFKLQELQMKADKNLISTKIITRITLQLRSKKEKECLKMMLQSIFQTAIN